MKSFRRSAPESRSPSPLRRSRRLSTSTRPSTTSIASSIGAAREIPIKGVTSAWLLEKIKNPNKKLIVKEKYSRELNFVNEIEKFRTVKNENFKTPPHEKGVPYFRESFGFCVEMTGERARYSKRLGKAVKRAVRQLIKESKGEEEHQR